MSATTAPRPVECAEARYDREGYFLLDAMQSHLACHNALPDVQEDFREQAVACVMDWLTNDEIAEAYKWSKIRTAGRVPA